MCKHHKVVLSISVFSTVASISEQALSAVPPLYTPGAHIDTCLLTILSYQSWSLNTYPCFMISQLMSCTSGYTCQIPCWVNRDKATLRKPINSQGAGMASLLAGQSMLSLTRKVAGWQSPRVLDRPSPRAAPPEWRWRWSQSTGHPVVAGIMSHNCRQMWEAAEPPTGVHPHLGTGYQAIQRERGTLCWADGLLC